LLTFSATELSETIVRILDAAGSLPDESAWVAETLVRANLMGHDSHGILRLPLYVERLLSGELVPGAPFEVEREAPALALVNGHQGWGQVVARQAMALGIEKARQVGLATVAVRNCQHVGRVGEWPTMAAVAGMIGLVFVNSRGGAGSVAPWGGVEGRLGTNPIAFAAPSGRDHPLLVDLCMSALPEGKVQLATHLGLVLPEGCLLDAGGAPTRDPALWATDPPGALLPLGGLLGHKGYALDLMVELLAGALTRSGVSGQGGPSGNGLLCQVFDIAAFVPLDEFTAAVEDLRSWVRSSRLRPGADEVLLPGDAEYRTMQHRSVAGIPVAPLTWAEVAAAAARVGVDLPG
jgi:hydroxycarboxylate dehydrogenase B